MEDRPVDYAFCLLTKRLPPEVADVASRIAAQHGAWLREVDGPTYHVCWFVCPVADVEAGAAVEAAVLDELARSPLYQEWFVA